MIANRFPHPALAPTGCEVLNFESHADARGEVFVAENLPYAVERTFWIKHVPNEQAMRGGHALTQGRQCLIALSGCFQVTLDDGQSEKWSCWLTRTNVGLLVPAHVWRELGRFTPDAVCLVLAETAYAETDYIRDRAVYEAGRRRPICASL